MWKSFDHKLGHWAILVTLSIVWGSSFILMKRGLDTFSFEQVAALRLFMAFLFLAWFGRKFYTSIPKNKILPIFLTGLIGNAIPAFLFTKSETYLDSGIVGILNVLTPLFTLFIGLLFYKLKVQLVNYAGIAIGMVGTVFLLFPDIQELNSKALWYSLMVIIATACYGWSTNIIKKHLQEVNSLQITTLSFTFIGPWAGVYLFTTDFLDLMQSHPLAWASLGYTVILAVIGSALAVIIFNELIKMTGALFAISCNYLIPIVAIVLGLLDSEQISSHHIGGFCIIVTGVYLLNKRS